LLKGLTHWVQDFYRVSDIPHINKLDHNKFILQLQRALTREEIRSNIRDQTKIAANASSPGPLESERKWKVWEEKFETYARSHLGANGIPLSYVIRKDDLPRLNGNFSDFLSQPIECAPLSGEYYMADRVTIFNMLVSFTTGHPSHDSIKVRFVCVMDVDLCRRYAIISKERAMRRGIKMRQTDSKIAYIIKVSDL